jgi:predicted O-linked N-acetylglucosamine transferase (SPINDLY family)
LENGVDSPLGAGLPTPPNGPLLGAGLPTPPIGRPKVFWPPGWETFGPEAGGVVRPAPSESEAFGPEAGGVVRPAPNGDSAILPEEAAATIRDHPNDRDPERRIRLGYVLPPFRAHPMGQWLRTLFDHHDRGLFEVIGYGDARGRDAVTDALRERTDGWCDIAGQSNDRVADQIRADRIDILIDLTGHAACSRLSVLARKPAPVQVTVLGRPATMGLDTIDYRLTDGYLDPPGQIDDGGTERLIRLPQCLWVFQPAYSAGAFPITPLPALARGFLTFGSLNPLDQVMTALEHWRKILHAVPASRLLLLAPPGSDCDAVSTFFAEGGIGDGRLAFVAQAGRVECLRSYDGIDIALDPFPCSGYASILDALWMGVPVVTLAGRTAVERAGVSILSNLGLSTPIARTPGEYVETAVRLAENLELLENVRPYLRERLLASPLADGPGYTAGLEAVLRKIWREWCAKPG